MTIVMCDCCIMLMTTVLIVEELCAGFEFQLLSQCKIISIWRIYMKFGGMKQYDVLNVDSNSMKIQQKDCLKQQK